MSPDGRHLAVASPLGAASPAYQRVQRLMVASTISGTERRWAAPQPAAGGRIVSLAWLDDDRTLAFSWWSSVAVPTPSAAVRLLDTAAPGTSYLRSRRRLALVNAAADFQDLAISGNGNVLASTPFRTLPKVAGKRGSSGSLVEFTGPASRPSFVFRATGRWNSPFEYCMDPLWISESGHQIIAPCFPIHPANSPGPYQVVLFQDGHATLLRPLARVYAALFTSVSQMMVFGG